MWRKTLFSLFLLMSPFACAKDPIVVGEKSLTVNKLDKFELIDIFTRKKQYWPDGHKIKVFTKPINSLEHKIFTMDILNMPPYRYKSILDSIVYSGTNTSVVELQTDEEMLDKLTTSPYSIGYINYKIYININTIKVIELSYD